MTRLTERQLIDMYRTWRKGSFGVTPNTQACVVAAAFAAHVLEEVEKSNADS